MLKRFSVAFAVLFVLATQSFASGTIPYSLSQQFDKFGHVLSGCKLNVYQDASTATPQIAYQDSALTIPVPGGSQLVCDAAGRLPQFFLADGTVKVLLSDKNGVTQVTADNIQVIGASSGGGGGGTVDPTTILATGDIKAAYGAGTLTGFVRLNGRTIGSATSGATERANSDTQALFQYLWNTDPNLVVLSGRGASANADWVANKQLTLPDCRGRALGGLDDMGNSAAFRLTTTYFGADGTHLGAVGGSESKAIITSNLPPYTPSGSFTFNSIGNGGSGAGQNVITGIQQSGGGNSLSPLFTAQGGVNTPLAVASPMMVTTFYIKL
jgi:hypothetical protein